MSAHMILEPVGAADPFYGADRGLKSAIELFLVQTYGTEIAHKFRGDVDHFQGIVTLGLPRLMGGINVYIIRISDCATYNGFQKTMLRASGELLERYRLSRERRHFSRDKFEEVASKVPLVGLNKAPVPE